MQLQPTGSPSAPASSGTINEKEWQSRCFARMVGLRPSAASAETGMLISAASTIGSFRGMAPEAAAERLLYDTDHPRELIAGRPLSG